MALLQGVQPVPGGCVGVRGGGVRAVRWAAVRHAAAVPHRVRGPPQEAARGGLRHRRVHHLLLRQGGHGVALHLHPWSILG